MKSKIAIVSLAIATCLGFTLLEAEGSGTWGGGSQKEASKAPRSKALNQIAEKAKTRVNTENLFTDIKSKEDWDAALAKAKAEGKFVLLDFTGSDWCGWCIKLGKEVFKTTEFALAAPNQFICIEVDWYKRKEMPEPEKSLKQSLIQKFGVRGFPTVLVLNDKGEELARTGYKAGGPKVYIRHLSELVSQFSSEDKKERSGS